MTRYLIPRWSLHHGEPLTTLTAHSRAEAFALVPLGAKLVALTSEFTVWAHAGIEYHLPRSCAREGLGAYRDSTLQIGDRL